MVWRRIWKKTAYQSFLLGDDSGIKEGGTIRRTGKVVSVPVGDALIGRVVNALGQPIDGQRPD